MLSILVLEQERTEALLGLLKSNIGIVEGGDGIRNKTHWTATAKPPQGTKCSYFKSPGK